MRPRSSVVDDGELNKSGGARCALSHVVRQVYSDGSSLGTSLRALQFHRLFQHNAIRYIIPIWSRKYVGHQAAKKIRAMTSAR